MLGYSAEAFSSAEEFLKSRAVERAQCLILDVNMPGLSGPELHGELSRQGAQVPVIFITAQADDSVRPGLVEQGAVECLFKPFSDEALLEALRKALGEPPDSVTTGSLLADDPLMLGATIERSCGVPP